ncbi:ThiF family adenylyltransferase [Carnobacterium divergens]|uniref:ThiF family adenylyltransferase n=1 Tax=Carnobacterium divergens TaxID=2748 RepID=UPI001072E7CE|nr:ThiF family adenylyltransferase [Carnobacterium divergens]TFI73212.1 hypothetical protein CKN81_06905 [Carnobacterium divergens]
MTMKFEENTTSENINIFFDVLAEFNQFKLIESDKNTVSFSYQDQYIFTCFIFDFDYNHNGVLPFIMVKNPERDFPHFLITDMTIAGQKYDYICLFETGQFIFHPYSYAEKLKLILKQLMKLLSLTEKQKEAEFQREFLYYWNRVANPKISCHTFIDTNNDFQLLNFYVKNSNYRIKSSTIKLNDSTNWKKQKRIVLYIPIINKSGILPPTQNSPWDSKTLLTILENQQVDKISRNSYKALRELSIGKKNIDIIFSFDLEDRKILFGCRIQFVNAGVKKFFDKIYTDIESIVPIILIRTEFDYLNKSIGNTVSMEPVGIIGVGSLGSYVVEELINSGVSNFVLIDDDIFVNENTFRHRLGTLWSRTKKISALKCEMELKHPQISIKSISKKVTAENVAEIVREENLKNLIITIGSTDQQIVLAKSLAKLTEPITVFHSWLEGDGKNSHTLVSKNNKTGCYNCLLKNDDGNFISNRANATTENDSQILRDGCGGTRVKYGNRTLLMATNGLIKAFEIVNQDNQSFMVSNHVDDGLTIEKHIKSLGCELCGK